MKFIVSLWFINVAFIKCVFGQAENVPNLAFPPNWDGDTYQHVPALVQGAIPDWLDGYHLVQTAGSYGRQSDPYGQKCTHLFDGIGAISAFEIGNGQVKFSAKYYPTRTYKIWDFYNRDFSQSKVAWINWDSPYNDTARIMWNNIPLYQQPLDSMFQTHPNIDFWRIGRQIVGATEHPDIGLTFNVANLTDFKHPALIETHDFFKQKSSIFGLTMAVHERKNQDDVIYAACAGFDPMSHKMYQIVSKVMPDGTRTVEGMFEQGTYDPSKCTTDGQYTGDKKILANYMHGITSTKNYVILPLTSIFFNPCRLPPLLDNMTIIQNTTDLPPNVKRKIEQIEYSLDVPMKFLVFDKRNKTFVTDKPIQMDVAMTPAHQFNAYEDDDGSLVVDMGVTDGLNGRMYDLLSVERILHGVGKVFRLLRFHLNLQNKTAKYENILTGQDYYDGEFPNFNQKFIERKYKYGYVLTGFLRAGGKISKIDMDAHKILAEFSAPGARAQWTFFREPYFVARPGGTDEDDGVVIALGGDANSKFSTLYVIDARTMTLLGQADIPTFVPLGLHNRFFFRSELGMNPTPRSPNSENGSQTNNPQTGIVLPDPNGLTWGGLLDQSKKVFCTLFKDLLDKADTSFCQETINTGK